MMFDKTYFSKTGNTFLLLHIGELLTHINGSAGCGSKIVVTSFLEFKGWTPTWQLLRMFYISSICKRQWLHVLQIFLWICLEAKCGHKFRGFWGLRHHTEWNRILPTVAAAHISCKTPFSICTLGVLHLHIFCTFAHIFAHLNIFAHLHTFEAQTAQLVLAGCSMATFAAHVSACCHLLLFLKCLNFQKKMNFVCDWLHALHCEKVSPRTGGLGKSRRSLIENNIMNGEKYSQPFLT